MLAQVGGDELRSRVPSDVSSVFSVDIHKNIISRTCLGSVFRIYIRSPGMLHIKNAGIYTDRLSGPYRALVLEF